jgi:class 3 adenylate cyclase/tetratricopeptide (TPR) repeat protein
MLCTRCRTENREGRRFCSRCGAGLATACPSCAFTNEPGDEFCGGCGARLGDVQPAQTKFTSPDIYTPKHLAEKILTSKSALEGERKQVTVLFADLKGSMELLVDRDPEEARKLLDPVLERMMEAVHRYEGTVNQVMGDGIMALFGAPLAHEDHGVRACYAALRMQESVKRYADEVRRSQASEVHIRVGLNSGEVVVRAIGSDLHMDYTAVGQTTHLAARMEQLATPGSVRLTAETLRHAEGYVEVKPLGPIPVKGLPEPIEVYDLVGPGAVRSRLHAAVARGLTRFVGRDSELDQLAQALERAGHGHGQIVAVVGEPGVGKSRLYWEFTHSPPTKNWLLLESGSVSYGKATPYLPVIGLLRAYFQVEDRDTPRKIHEKITGRVMSLDHALEPFLPALLGLLDVPVEDPQWERLDPPQRRLRTLEAVKHLLNRESHVQPLVVQIEDLHWIDAETQASLDNLVESLPGSRILLLLSYRPEYQHRWTNKAYYRQLRIDALPQDGADQLLQSLLGDDAQLQPLKRLLIRRTEGNPLFLEESVRALVETRALRGERGAYQLAKPLGTIQIPSTVQVILAARIDRLRPEDKQLLQAASVIGDDVPFNLLRAIAGVSDEALQQGLGRLQSADFLFETRLFPDLEYAFKHGLTHQVAYHSLLQDRRRALHAAIVGAIEAFYPDRLTEQVEQLARHAFRGELWDQALTYLGQAGAKAAARSAYYEAAEYFERALEANTNLVPDRVSIEHAIELRFALRNALWPVGAFARILPHLLEAQSAAHSLGDGPRVGRAYSYITQYFWMVGEQTRAIEAGHQALSIGRSLKDLSVLVPTNLHLGLAFHASGDYPKAVEVLLRNVDICRGDLAREHFGLAALPSVYSRTWAAWSLAELGEFSEAIQRGQEEKEIADTAGHPLTRVSAYLGIGYVYLRKGEWAEAIAALEPALEWCQTLAVPFWLPVASSLLGYAYAQSGRIAEGLPLLEAAVERAASTGRKVDQALWSAHLSETHVLAGHIEEGRRIATAALALARSHGEKGNEAHVLRLLAILGSGRDPVYIADVPRDFDQALHVATNLSMRPLVAHCRLGLGKLYHRTGDRAKTEEHLATAAAMYGEMDMRFWLEQAEAGLRGLG